VESSLSAAATTYTYAATPSSGSFSNVLYTSFTVTWTANNPVGTRFEISRSTTSDNFATGVSTPIAFADNFTSNTTFFTGLVPGVTYYIRIHAENELAGDEPITPIVTPFST